jgi:hypothetical protein
MDVPDITVVSTPFFGEDSGFRHSDVYAPAVFAPEGSAPEAAGRGGSYDAVVLACPRAPSV